MSSSRQLKIAQFRAYNQNGSFRVSQHELAQFHIFAFSSCFEGSNCYFHHTLRGNTFVLKNISTRISQLVLLGWKRFNFSRKSSRSHESQTFWTEKSNCRQKITKVPLILPKKKREDHVDLIWFLLHNDSLSPLCSLQPFFAKTSNGVLEES